MATLKDELELLFTAGPGAQTQVVRELMAMRAEAETTKIRLSHAAWKVDRAEQHDHKQLGKKHH